VVSIASRANPQHFFCSQSTAAMTLPTSHSFHMDRVHWVHPEVSPSSPNVYSPTSPYILQPLYAGATSPFRTSPFYDRSQEATSPYLLANSASISRSWVTHQRVLGIPLCHLLSHLRHPTQFTVPVLQSVATVLVNCSLPPPLSALHSISHRQVTHQ